MKAVIQRVSQASVIVDGQTVSSINQGFLALISFEQGDEEKDLKYMAQKILQLRIFDNEEGKFDLSLKDIGGELLVVSQFTLSGDVRKGNRPDFTKALSSTEAMKMYQKFINLLRNEYPDKVKEGVFQAHMEISLVNDGPVTILISSKKEF